MVFSTYPLGVNLPKIMHLCILILILYVNNSTMTKFDAISIKESPILASLQNMEYSIHYFSSVDCSFSDLEDSVLVGKSKNHLRSLRSWLSPVARSVKSGWKRCWRASVDGWAASTFHSRCDGKGPTVTIIRVGRYIFGGYTSIPWGK